MIDAETKEETNHHLPLPQENDSEAPPLQEKKEFEKEQRSKYFEDFLKHFEELPTPEAKLHLAIEAMKASISQGGSPNFKNFWEARRLCLPLFKENIPQVIRNELWAQYGELSKEARRLKEILDENSAFAVEQIGIAITALEKDIVQVQESLPLAENLTMPKSLEAQKEYYQKIQGELDALNTQAARINALRKELIKTEMRIRQKNQFFQRLSAAGDQIFPRRKELIKEMSIGFTNDVEAFITHHFAEISHNVLFYLREEIKLLQSLAKELTLNAASFTKTRQRLSECWDKLKIEEKELKKERAQQKAVFKQNTEALNEKIQDCQNRFAAGQISNNEASAILDEMATTMRQTELGRDDIKTLREQMNELRKMVQDRIREEEEAKKQQEHARDQQKKEKHRDLKKRIQDLAKNCDSYDADRLSMERESLLAEIQQIAASKLERQELERLLKPIRDAISEKKEKNLLALSDDDKASLSQLEEILKQRLERQQEIKNQLEVLRKAAGSSGVDFEKAMNYQNQIHEEKERLEKVKEGIKEVQEMIAQIREN